MQSSQNSYFMLDELAKSSSSDTTHLSSSYREEAFRLQEPNFESLLNLSKRRLKSMGHSGSNASEQLYDSLNRGTAILQQEKQVDKYMQAFGQKHYVKFKTLFENVPSEIFDGFFDVVDWGCGMGLGIIALDDFCRKKLERRIESQVRQITLIEPSEVALERAGIHAELLFPESLLTFIPKRFEDLIKNDFPPSALGVPRLHLFFNVLDMDVFNQEKNRTQIFNFIKDTFLWNEYFLCLSPCYNNVGQTLMSMVSSLKQNDDLQLETLLSPTEKSFTMELNGCEVKGIRDRSRKAQDKFEKIKNKTLLYELNSRRDSTSAQRALVSLCSDMEYDILYRPNLMGDSPDMLVLKKGHKAKLIYVCDVADTTTESLNEVIKVAYVADSLKARLYNLLSRSLIEAIKTSGKAFNIVTCVIFIPKLQINISQLKSLLVKAELDSQNKPVIEDDIMRIEKAWQYREIYTGNIRLKLQSTAMMSNEIYTELKNLTIPKATDVKQEKIVFKPGSKQASIVVSVEGAHKKVFGVFGSGKTTAMVARSILAYKRTHSIILILTFNITLRGYIENMLLRQFGSFNRNQFYVVNYHEFIKGECHFIGITKGIPYDDYSFFKQNGSKFRQYRAIFIDEAQDYKIDWFRIIKEVFLAENGEYVLCGDEKQNIYGNPIDEKDRKIKTNIRGNPIILTTCYRSNYEIT
ncbi:MAG: AAA family ATPase, partial [Desulfamplus sp.]|nr:AAA family ATPase [Desulfamplus sp.]